MDMRQQLGLSQQQKLSPRLIQSMEILQLPVQALQERIDHELENNIALEVDEHLAGESPAGVEESTDRPEASVEQEGEGTEDFKRLAAMERTYGEAMDNEYSSQSWSASRMRGERDRKMDAMANISARGDNLIDQVLHQWSFAEVSEDVALAGRLLIEHLNTNGILDLPLEEIAERQESQGALPLATLQQAHGLLVHLVDPPGIGAQTIKQSLLLQIEAWKQREPEDTAVWDRVAMVVESHLDDLVQNRLPVIARETGLGLDDIKTAMEYMHRLTLSPGRTLVDESVPPVIPDVIVEYDQERDQYFAAMCDGLIPPLRVSPRYSDMSKDKDLDGDTRSFLSKNVNNARWLIESINQRRTSVLRVVEVVIDRQRAWFDVGPRGLKPLPMTEVADLLGVHVATVSRAVADKWMQTPRGIVPLRRFFSGGTETSGGQQMSWEAVRQVMVEIIEGEDPAKPLGDEAIAEALREQGVDIARRTVVKYRQRLGIPPARLRRTY